MLPDDDWATALTDAASPTLLDPRRPGRQGQARHEQPTRAGRSSGLTGAPDSGVADATRCADADANATVDDGRMTGWRRVLLWAASIVGGVALVALGVFVTVTNPIAAGLWSSVLGAFIGLVGVALSVYGIVLARRASDDTSTAQSVTDSTISGDVTQVRRVKGGVKLGAAPPVLPIVGPAPPSGTSTPPAAPPVGGQSVIGSQVAGPVRQIDDVGGDVETDR
ncbi:hypothetical protein [Kutzneria sp. NPDC051319]|uniref:hypothetical protein n=1 Tax=Kutzneria sp. NPDC051319 TaxID=3155047 RepID=UPI00341B79D0